MYPNDAGGGRICTNMMQWSCFKGSFSTRWGFTVTEELWAQHYCLGWCLWSTLR